jgi:hypothetical protein
MESPARPVPCPTSETGFHASFSPSRRRQILDLPSRTRSAAAARAPGGSQPEIHANQTATSSPPWQPRHAVQRAVLLGTCTRPACRMREPIDGLPLPSGAKNRQQRDQKRAEGMGGNSCRKGHGCTLLGRSPDSPARLPPNRFAATLEQNRTPSLQPIHRRRGLPLNRGQELCRNRTETRA